MASSKILLQAKAKRLGIAPEQYRKLSESELQDLIATAAKGTKGSGKGSAAKGSTNGSVAKKGSATKGSGATKGSATKGSVSKTAPATSAKSSTKGASTKGTAKRQSAAAGAKKGSGTTAKKGTAKASTAKRTAAKASTQKNTTAKRSRKSVEGRSPLNRDKIDWEAESNVGATPGKRMDVMKKLRQFKGDSAKVFKSLRAKAQDYYPNKNEHAAERQLVWLINRVAYDFAYKTGQHEQGTRAAYGTSTAAQDIRRREQREAERKEQEKAERARKRKAAERKAAKGGKAASKRSTAKKGTAKRGAARKGSK